VSGFALVEVISNCHVLYGRMNELGDAAHMIEAMDPATHRTNPTLLRRGRLPLRLTSPEAPAWPVAAAPLDGVQDEARLPRGVIFERHGSVDLSQRYRARLGRAEEAR
jgi:hypothetical protein